MTSILRHLGSAFRRRAPAAADPLSPGATQAAGPAAQAASAAAPAAAHPLPPTFAQNAAYIRIHPSAVIAPSASLKIFAPPETPQICLEIGARSHIFGHFAILRPEATIRIGDRCQIGASSFIAKESITLEGDNLVAWGVTVMDTDAHSIYWNERQHDVERCLDDYLLTDGWDLARSHDWSTVNTAPITIGRKAWLGFNSIVLQGIRIGEGCIVGAGSVVTKDVPDWHIAGGNPCRTLRPITPDRPQGDAR